MGSDELWPHMWTVDRIRSGEVPRSGSNVVAAEPVIDAILLGQASTGLLCGGRLPTTWSMSVR